MVRGWKTPIRIAFGSVPGKKGGQILYSATNVFPQKLTHEQEKTGPILFIACPESSLQFSQSTEWPISSPPPATLIHPSPPLCSIHEIEIVTDAIRELIPFPHTTTYVEGPKK